MEKWNARIDSIGAGSPSDGRLPVFGKLSRHRNGVLPELALRFNLPEMQPPEDQSKGGADEGERVYRVRGPPPGILANGRADCDERGDRCGT